MGDIKFTTQSAKAGGFNFKKIQKFVIILAIIIAVLIVGGNSFAIVNEGFIGVKYRFGQIVGTNLSAGLNFKIPFIEKVQMVDVKEQAYTVNTDAYTSDTQTVQNLQIKLNYYYDKNRLSEIIRETGIENVEAKWIVPQVNSITKDVIGKYTAINLVNARVDVQLKIKEALESSLAPSGIVVTNFALENLSFEDSFEEAVRAKVIAEQASQKAKNETARISEEASQKLIKADAEAQSQLKIAEAEAKAIALIREQLVNNPQYIEYLKATKWDGVLPQAIGNEINPFINFDESTTATNSNENITE